MPDKKLFPDQITVSSINSAANWESFLARCKPNTFLQSWAWGKVQRGLSEQVKYLGFYSGSTQVAVALVILVNAKRGRHYLIPHGPILLPGVDVGAVVRALTVFLRSCAGSDGATAMRIAPLFLQNDDTENLFKQLKFISAPLHVHAERTWLLDITGSEEKLLSGMRKTTRQAINKAAQAGVQIDIINDRSALDRFWPLYETTRTRHGFVPWSREALSLQLEQFGANNQIYTVLARYQQQDLAAAICINYGSTVFYYHGASGNVFKEIPAAQLVQWHAILEARRRKAGHYNFWGIAPENQPKHPFAGITTFKKGFGGQALDYMHARDLPFTWGYLRLWLIDSFRKWRRGF